MLELKIIEPGESDFTSPLILVEAQGKEARPCIDYRRFNKVTRTQFFPLPNIEELLEKCDASNHEIGVVLSQVCENEEHPIMFLSKRLSLAEQKFSTTEKECAAIIFAVQKLKCYLDGHQNFAIQTDHNPLVWFDSRRRSGQSDHRFNNHGVRQGVSRNGVFRDQNGQDRSEIEQVFQIYEIYICNKLGEVSVGREVEKMSISQSSPYATAVNEKPPLSNNTETEKQ
ncbi:retrovirus-related Pol polyprotein from transposon 17.6 [Trichonephila clavipes]|nr:retrovirus-related Pol polyprotein from transposon 17.6 [Trichonephila clavipes]